MTDAEFKHTDGGSQGKREGANLKEEARQTFENVRNETAEQAKQTGRHVRQRAEETLESGKAKLSAQVGSVSKALHRGSESFREDGQEELAEQSARLADRVGEVRSFIDDYGADGVYEEVRHLATSRPIWMVGGAAVVGLAAAALISGRKELGRGGGRGPRR